MEIEKVAFEGPKEPDRGYTIKVSYLKGPQAGNALVEIFKNGKKTREFLWPAYKIWNLQAHFKDIVDGEIKGDTSGYAIAGWPCISANVEEDMTEKQKAVGLSPLDENVKLQLKLYEAEKWACCTEPERRIRAEFERDNLAEAIRNAAIKAGLCRGDVKLTGPHLIMLCKDMAEAINVFKP